ncbi:hypothetical protein PLICRDRAFT_40849 [Plicaturopsis crispa FD-325 SS-3]|nr:hypothetical protein PLICRDRAFT_40849 [Plicaturopsis crispa FD-325 SS-3]
MAPPLPAFQTKHIHLLEYPFLNHSFLLAQQDDGGSNGTALWLGAQCLSLYLADVLRKHRATPSSPRPRLVELGSGIGLSALAAAALGWDVLATDVPAVISTVLTRNVEHNTPLLSPDSAGSIQIRELDWTVPPEEWRWDNDSAIASATSPPAAPSTAGQLRPPFDLIITSDTLYSPSLIDPLLRTLHALAVQSFTSRPPPIYVCIERRDPALIDTALARARDTWGFTTERISQGKVSRAMSRHGGIKWAKDDWDGVEVWKLVLQRSSADTQYA